jgi:NADH-quinone oxidoreductase subunit H
MRYDQLMDFGWKFLIPLSLGWLLVIAAIEQSRWWGVAVLVGCGLVYLVLQRSRDVSRQRRDLLADEADAARYRLAPRDVLARSVLDEPGGDR